MLNHSRRCILLYFWILHKILKIMMCHLLTFNCLFRNYKQLKIVILALRQLFMTKRYKIRQNEFHISILVFQCTSNSDIIYGSKDGTKNDTIGYKKWYHWKPFMKPLLDMS